MQNDAYINQNVAAKRCGISRQRLAAYIKAKNPGFSSIDPLTKAAKINTNHPEWKRFEKEMLADESRKPPTKQTSNRKSIGMSSLKKHLNDAGGPDLIDDNIRDLTLKAERALREQEISKAKIAQQKAIQEEIKTLEKQKAVAPIELISFFFSFLEGMNSRILRRPTEIEAEIESLFMAGEKKKATQKIIREMESIIKDTQKELLASMKSEGYKYE